MRSVAMTRAEIRRSSTSGNGYWRRVMGSHVSECHGEEDQTIIVRKGVCLGRRGNDRKGPNCPAGLEQAAENRRLLQIGLGSRVTSMRWGRSVAHRKVRCSALMEQSAEALASPFYSAQCAELGRTSDKSSISDRCTPTSPKQASTAPRASSRQS